MGHLHVVPADGAGVDTDRRFDSLYRTHFRDVYAYFVRRVPAADVPDLVADVFTTAWRRIDQVPRPPDDRLWLYGVARRVASQHDRGHRRRQRLVTKIMQNSPPSYRLVVEHEPHLHALDLIDRLKADERELVRLVVWEQLSHAEVGAVLGCSANAVAIRWHRSIERLRHHLNVTTDLTTPASRRQLRRARTEEL
jgi:RNA polymerase sigma-70 factor (ECF subfamily)